MSTMQEAGGVEPWMQSHDVSQTRGLVVCLLTSQMLVRCTILLRVRRHLEAMPLSQYDEAHLIARAEVIVDRAPAPRVGAPVVPRNELIQQAAEELQENHDCNHQGHRAWQRTTRGNLMCENCFYTLPQFILECRQCHLRACLRCTRNRL